jgi:hypothetical protein
VFLATCKKTLASNPKNIFLVIMHVKLQNSIEMVNFRDLEALRCRLGISQTRLCQRAEINPTTYQRWLRNMRGESGGSAPHRRSLAAVSAVLRDLEQQETPNAGDPGEAMAWMKRVTAGKTA